jgi:hypothetical protein
MLYRFREAQAAELGLGTRTTLAVFDSIFHLSGYCHSHHLQNTTTSYKGLL